MITISGELNMWVDQGTLCIKAATKQGDPVELTLHEARELRDGLIKLIDDISDVDNGRDPTSPPSQPGKV